MPKTRSTERSESPGPSKGYFAGLSASTFLLALTSLFADIASEMLYPILPIFLTQELGASVNVIGLIEGVAQATQYISQGLSGFVSDKLRRRKTIALLGYSLSAIAKPLIGFSATWSGALGARALDRLGAGTRAAPRDALVAASASEEDRGKAFGLEGAGDNLGAFLGPLLAVTLVGWLHVRLRSMFYLSIVPGVLAASMVIFTRDAAPRVPSQTTLAPRGARLPPQYLKVLAVTAVFGLGNSSNSFLVLRTKALGASLTTTILIYAAFNLIAALASYPAGHLSDRVGRKGVLLVSFLVFTVVYAGFGLTANVVVIGFLFVLYGMYQGIFRAVGKALATDFLPDEVRATGLGWYAATVGVTGLVANLVGGELWARFGPPATFFFGAASALLGSLALVLLVRSRNRDA